MAAEAARVQYQGLGQNGMMAVEHVYLLVERGLETLVQASRTADPEQRAIMRTKAYEILEESHKQRTLLLSARR